jgi:hypothetical protein
LLKLFAVKVSRVSEPRESETIWVRTYTARHAQHLAIETFPGCDAQTLGVFMASSWRSIVHDD